MTDSGHDDGDPPVDGKSSSDRRFKKGQSGNPRGRPKKALPDPPKDRGDSSSRDLLIEEAARIISLTEHGVEVRMPVIQAVIRASGICALKGNAQAQKTFIYAVTAAELAVTNAKLAESAEKERAFLAAALQQLELEVDRKAWTDSGRDEMDMPVHPGDIELDWATMGVNLYVALTAGQLAARDTAIQARDEAQMNLCCSTPIHENGVDNELVRLWLEIDAKIYDKCNSLLPSRVRTQPCRRRARC